MAETREQFRDRIRKVGQMAMLVSDYPDDSVGQVVDGLEAVYAEALRDIRAAIVQRGRLQGVPWLAAPDIDQFAAERGIDLEA